MKTRSLIRILPIALLLLATGVLVTRIYFSAPPASPYKSCTTLAARDPGKALQTALDWRRKDPLSPAARHCQAMALYGLKDYRGAAAILATLAEDTAATNPALSLSLVAQSVTAYKAANLPDEAVVRLSDMLKLPDDKLPAGVRVGVLTAQAKLYQDDKNPSLAIDDVNEALAIEPENQPAKSLLSELYKETSPAR